MGEDGGLGDEGELWVGVGNGVLDVEDGELGDDGESNGGDSLTERKWFMKQTSRWLRWTEVTWHRWWRRGEWCRRSM